MHRFTQYLIVMDVPTDLSWKTFVEHRTFKPSVILLLTTLLVVLHRYVGSVEFAKAQFPFLSGFGSAVFMFLACLVLFGFIPSLVVHLLFRESIKEYGVQIGDYQFGILALIILFPLIAAALLFPGSQTTDLRDYYPLDRSAGVSVLGFVRYEATRGVLFYTAWEFLFRGFVLFGLRRYVGDWMAVCIQTIPSCLWHIGLPAGEILMSIPGGVLFGLLALRTRSLVWPFLIHWLIGIGLDFFIIITQSA